MSHEVLQVIKLVKYNRKSHEMISVTCKCIPTTVNKEMHKNEHSHEMMRFRNRITVWSSLHELVLIYGSSHGSVFELPMFRVHDGHKSESCPRPSVTELGTPERIWFAVAHNYTLELIRTSNRTHTHIRIQHTRAYINTPIYINLPTYTYVHLYT